MTARKPMTAWQEENTPVCLPVHIRRNIKPSDEGCWLWSRSRNRHGYGWASFQNRTHEAHRLVYVLIKGDVPEGLVLDHLCRVRHCVNPDHLDPVTPAVNLQRSPLTPSGTKNCSIGHALEHNGHQRLCPICHAEYTHSRRDFRREYMRQWRQGKKKT